MNSTIRNLVIAAPLATAALTVVPAAAMATEPGPVIVIQPADPDPEPKPELKLKAAEPDQPKGPQDKAPAPKPQQPKGPGDITNPEPTGPTGPGDITNPEAEPTGPQGPGDLTAPKPCPTHGVDCTPDDDPKVSGGNGGNGDGRGEAKHSVTGVVDTVELPSRIDAGLAAQEQDGGLELAWWFAGGLAVTATGAAFAVRRRTQARG